MRQLIETHLNHCSIDQVERAIQVCESNLYKGDIFSLGCILYEMATLRVAFENRFQLSKKLFSHQSLGIDAITNYSEDLRLLIKHTLSEDPYKRLDVYQIVDLDFVKSRTDQDFSSSFRRQMIPNLVIDSKFAKQNVLECIKVELSNSYKPIKMNTLKHNQNLIVILANKHVNMQKNRTGLQAIASKFNNLSPFGTSKDEAVLIEEGYFEETPDGNFIEEAMIFIYNEYGIKIKEFNSFLLSGDSGNREFFNFQVFDFCVDEENDHLYISTRKHGILRFKILNKYYYFEELIFNGRLNLTELLSIQSHKCFPTCLNLIENETIFGDSMRTTGKRRLLFNDRQSKRIISVQVDLSLGLPSLDQDLNFNQLLDRNSINCYIKAGLTLEQRYVRQMVSTDNELICLFDDLNQIKVYDLKTLLFLRSNCESNQSAKRNSCCLTIDSYNNIYSTNGESIFNLDYKNFTPSKRVRPLTRKGQNLSHIISWMSILTNSKLVLLTDAVQLENSLLFILKSVSSNLNASSWNKKFQLENE